MWDDVVHAIRDDLRAFRGLWETDIARRLGPGVPMTYQDAKAWKPENTEDTVGIFARLR